MSSSESEEDLAGRLIERLLVDPEFRAEFRRDPSGACVACGLPGLAVELGGSGKAMHTMELRESRSSLAGVVMAIAAEGIALEQVERLASHGLPGGLGKALHGVKLPKEAQGLRKAASAPAGLEHKLEHKAGVSPASLKHAAGAGAAAGRRACWWFFVGGCRRWWRCWWWWCFVGGCGGGGGAAGGGGASSAAGSGGAWWLVLRRRPGRVLLVVVGRRRRAGRTRRLLFLVAVAMGVRARGIRVRRVPARGALIRPNVGGGIAERERVRLPRLLRLLRGRAPGGQTKHPRPEARHPPCPPARGSTVPAGGGSTVPAGGGSTVPAGGGAASTVPAGGGSTVLAGGAATVPAGAGRPCRLVLARHPASWRARAALRAPAALPPSGSLACWTPPASPRRRPSAPGWNPAVWTPESCRCSIPSSRTTRSAFPTSRS